MLSLWRLRVEVYPLRYLSRSLPWAQLSVPKSLDEIIQVMKSYCMTSITACRKRTFWTTNLHVGVVESVLVVQELRAQVDRSSAYDVELITRGCVSDTGTYSLSAKIALNTYVAPPTQYSRHSSNTYRPGRGHLGCRRHQTTPNRRGLRFRRSCS